MYMDANDIPNDKVLSGYDVCIVGAGAAGIAMAVRLIPTGKNVLVITSGSSSAVKPPPSPADESMYEGLLGPFMQKVDARFLIRSRLRMYGGTTNHFGYWARPLEEADLKPRPGYRDASWPLDIAELNRYYPDANDTGHFGPFNYEDIAFWARALGGRPFPPLPGDQLQNAIFHSQSDTDINHFQIQFGEDLRDAPNITVIFNASVLTVEASEHKNHVAALDCRSVDAKGDSNSAFKIESRSYVLAQGGIEVVRLLKLSGGLGDNAKGQLGRGFMVHPLIREAARVTFPEPVDLAIFNFFREQRVRIPCRITANREFRAITGPMYHPEELVAICTPNAWGVLEPKPHVMDAEKIGNFRLIFRFDWDLKSARVDINWEQVPNESSTITLDPVVTDPVFHQPVVRLDWNLLEPDKQTVRKGLDLCRQYLLAPGRDANKFEITTDLSGGPEHWTFDPSLGDGKALHPGDHHMGATRMSLSHDDGIVNQNLRIHSVDNLYVASSSVFPTSGYANPTLTIVALAIRLADHLNQLLV
jgi:choline dehydrogenase-like flavoprotein